MKIDHRRNCNYRSVLVCVLLTFILINPIGAQDSKNDDDVQHDIRLLVLGYPLMPAMSEVRYRFQPAQLWRPLNDRLAFNTWYMASSGYLMPDPFLEVGITATYTIFDNNVLSIEAGGGTAFSMDGDDNYALPLVTEFLGRYSIGNSPVAIDWRLQGLLYSNGLVVDLMTPVHVVIGKSGFYFEAVPGFNLGYQFEDNITSAAPKLGFAAGLVF